MRKIVLFIVLSVVCVGFVSCSNDDDDTATSGSIVGRWIANYVILVYEGQRYEVPADELSDCDNFLEFFDDDTVIIELLYGVNCEHTEISEATWIQSGNTIVVSDFDPADPTRTNTLEVVELTQSLLKIRDLDEIANLEEDDYEDIIRVFKRL